MWGLGLTQYMILGTNLPWQLFASNFYFVTMLIGFRRKVHLIYLVNAYIFTDLQHGELYL